MRWSRSRDHPRVCGEHFGRALRACDPQGSSPRVRGTPCRDLRAVCAAGIIPACAGNTPSAAVGGSRIWDHPRVCGEHYVDSAINPTYAGSSPRVRGTPVHGVEQISRGGIIPACAGNTRVVEVAAGLVGDHPRVCGEHCAVSFAWAASVGSSPRVRGTQCERQFIAAVLGIIPACAGNTIWLIRAPYTDRDHPRVCGEHYGRYSLPTASVGSSPRVRGTPTAVPTSRRRLGIIPACAGNTLALFVACVLERDHPRVCGEHPPLFHLRLAGSGSSPRVRGTLRV